MNPLAVLMRFSGIYKEKLVVDVILFVKMIWLKPIVNVRKLAQSLIKFVISVSLVATVKKVKFLMRAPVGALNRSSALAQIL